MDAWFGKAVFLAATLGMIVIRAPHVRRSTRIKVVASRIGPLEVVPMVFVALGLFLPFVWVAAPWLGFADYPLRPVPFGAGLVCYGLGLWLLHRSHADLGRNWSNTLQIREEHRLVTEGVYRRIRHPMYVALLLHGAGQALVVANALAGPLLLLAFTVLFALRVGPEERMMRETFGSEYDAYAGRTRRFLP